MYGDGGMRVAEAWGAGEARCALWRFRGPEGSGIAFGRDSDSGGQRLDMFK